MKVPTLEEPIEENTDAVEAGPKVSAEKDKLEIDERVAALQKLVEKHQDKTEKEIIRTLKVCRFRILLRYVLAWWVANLLRLIS